MKTVMIRAPRIYAGTVTEDFKHQGDIYNYIVRQVFKLLSFTSQSIVVAGMTWKH